MLQTVELLIKNQGNIKVKQENEHLYMNKIGNNGKLK